MVQKVIKEINKMPHNLYATAASFFDAQENVYILESYYMDAPQQVSLEDIKQEGLRIIQKKYPSPRYSKHTCVSEIIPTEVISRCVC